MRFHGKMSNKPIATLRFISKHRWVAQFAPYFENNRKSNSGIAFTVNIEKLPNLPHFNPSMSVTQIVFLSFGTNVQSLESKMLLEVFALCILNFDCEDPDKLFTKFSLVERTFAAHSAAFFPIAQFWTWDWLAFMGMHSLSSVDFFFFFFDYIMDPTHYIYDFLLSVRHKWHH